MIARSFQERLVGREEAPSSWRIVKSVPLRKPGAELEKGISSYTAVALTSVMSNWYATVILRLEKEKGAIEELKQLHVGGIDGISCQHLQVRMSHPQKHREWEEDGRRDFWHGSERRPAMSPA